MKKDHFILHGWLIVATGIIGSVWFSLPMGGSVGPWLRAWIFEFFNSYLVAFIGAMVLYVVACAAIWYAASRKAQRVPGR